MNNKQSGFTIIELVIFITVIALVSLGIIITFENTMRLNYSQTPFFKAAALARSRMEIIIFNRQNNYVGVSDPCSVSTSGICAALSSFATSENLTVLSTISESGANKTITVNVNLNNGNSYPLQTIVSDYE